MLTIMAELHYLQFVLVFCCWTGSNGDINAWPCDSHVIEDNRKPPLPPQQRFHADIEIVFSYVYPKVPEFNAYSIDYDNEGNRVALTTLGSYGTGKGQRRIIDYGNNQTFIIETGKDQTCKVVRPAEDDTYRIFANFPGVLEPISPGRIFQSHELFGMDPNHREGYLGKGSLRNNVTCDVWLYCYRQTESVKNVLVYWSEPGWYNAGSNERSLMGVVWRQKKTSVDEAEETVMTVANLVPDYINEAAFQVPNGDSCRGVNSKPFPKILKNDVFRFKTEIHVPDNRLIMYSNNWVDMMYGYARKTVDMPLDLNSNGLSVNTLDYKRLIAFTQDNDSPDGCKVTPIATEIGMIESISNLHLIGVGNVSLFFEPPGVQWIYVGKQHHRQLPTEVWQATRTDWPPVRDETVTSVWEWHMANVPVNKYENGKAFQLQQLVPVHLRITIIKAGPNPILGKGSVLLFHLYDFRMYEAGSNDLADFDVSDCYREEWKQHIEFKVNITGPLAISSYLLEHHIRNPSFLLQWQVLLADYTLDGNLLRISKMESYINAKQEVVIQFWLLDKHPAILTETSSMDLPHAREALRIFVDEQPIPTPPDTMGTPIVGSLQDVALDFHPDEPTTTEQSSTIQSEATTTKQTTTILGETTTPKNTATIHGETTTPKNTATIHGETTTPKNTATIHGETTTKKNTGTIHGKTTIPKQTTTILGETTTPKQTTRTPINPMDQTTTSHSKSDEVKPEQETFYSSGTATGVGIGLFMVGLTTGGGITLLLVVKNFSWCIKLRGKPW